MMFATRHLWIVFVLFLRGPVYPTLEEIIKEALLISCSYYYATQIGGVTTDS